MLHSDAYTPVAVTDTQALQQSQGAAGAAGDPAAAPPAAPVAIRRRTKGELLSTENILIIAGTAACVLVLVALYSSCRRQKLAAMEYTATEATQMAARQ